MIDYNVFQDALIYMMPRQKMYEMIKKEMIRRGRWKAKGRGKPFGKKM